MLFNSAHHDFINPRGHYGVLKGKNLKQRIEDFVAWVNREAPAQGLPDQTIPADPHGAIGLATGVPRREAPVRTVGTGARRSAVSSAEGVCTREQGAPQVLEHIDFPTPFDEHDPVSIRLTLLSVSEVGCTDDWSRVH